MNQSINQWINRVMLVLVMMLMMMLMMMGEPINGETDRESLKQANLHLCH
jgi:ABC-type uncharacterized transport system ATPase subunit